MIREATGFGGGEGRGRGSSWGLEVMGKFKGTWVWGEGGGGQVLGGGVTAGSPPQNWLGLGVSPFRLFSSWIGGCLILIVMTVAGR